MYDVLLFRIHSSTKAIHIFYTTMSLHPKTDVVVDVIEDCCIFFGCDECDYILDGKCALLPEKVKKNRYDDHLLFLSYGDMNVDEKYWCEVKHPPLPHFQPGFLGAGFRTHMSTFPTSPCVPFLVP